MSADKKQRGDYGEQLAQSYLEAQGYRLLERNWRYGHKELDLVMRQGEAVVFVEVKARTSTAYGTPGEAVTAKKRKNLLTAARAYLAAYGLSDAPARFDVLEVDLHSGAIRQVENAFGE